MAMVLGSGRGLQGQTMIETQGLGFMYPDQGLLFSGIDLRIQFGERIGLIGRNGTGKSTFLRLLEGSLLPGEGRIERAKNLDIVRFDQEMADLPKSGTVLSAIKGLLPEAGEGECRSHLARFLFCGEDVDKEIEHLSGGEKRRLHLARLVLQPADILLLDEPTNHLDISTREVLEDCIDAYNGTILAVSHDRWFLEKCIHRILELTPGGLVSVPSDLKGLEQRSSGKSPAGGNRRETQDGRVFPPPSTGGDGGAKIRNPWAFARLEEEIIELEEEMNGLDEALSENGVWRDTGRLKEIQARKERIQSELEDRYRRWENWQ